jgi:hypothetical protein
VHLTCTIDLLLQSFELVAHEPKVKSEQSSHLPGHTQVVVVRLEGLWANMLSERQFRGAQRRRAYAAIQSYKHLTRVGISTHCLLMYSPRARGVESPELCADLKKRAT